MTAACAWLAVRDERCCRRLEHGRICRAGQEASEIAAVAMDEGDLLTGELGNGLDRRRRGSCVLKDDILRAPVDPQPDVVLRGRRVAAAQAADQLERSESVRNVPRREALPQVGAE